MSTTDAGNGGERAAASDEQRDRAVAKGIVESTEKQQIQYRSVDLVEQYHAVR